MPTPDREARQALADWLERRHGVTGVDPGQVLPVLGPIELVTSLPLHLGMGPADLLVHPRLAGAPYALGARAVGARVLAADALTALGPERPRLVWIDTPSDPTGRVLREKHLRKVVDWCRERGVLLVSDESRLGLVWEGEASSVLHPAVCGGSHDGLLALHDPAAGSDLGGDGCAFVTGDATIVAGLGLVRERLGLGVPGPVLRMTAAVLGDDDRAADRRRLHLARRARLRGILVGAGFTIEHSEASLHLWATRGDDGRETAEALAGLGVAVAPGDRFGPAGGRHVRVSFTATDEELDALAERLG